MSSQNLSHPLATRIALVLHYKVSKKYGVGETVMIHRDGCNHPAGSVKPFTGYLADDYFIVAPCARFKGGQ